MRINISARHLELTKPLADYIQKKVEKSQKYFDHPVWAQIIITVEKKYRQVAEIIIHSGKISFRAKDESIDLYAAVDLAMEKLDKQLVKRKEIMKDSHKGKALSEAKMEGSGDVKPSGSRNIISETKRYNIKPMSVREAIDEMEAIGESFYMFMNEQTSQVSVVYVTATDSYGLIEPKA
jgi:putative sigma-54 modulation protein